MVVNIMVVKDDVEKDSANGGVLAEPKTTGQPLLEGLKSLREPMQHFHTCVT